MAVEQIYKITVNTKKKMFRDIPEVVANDNVIFDVEVWDDAILFPLDPTYTYHLVSQKISRQSVIREGTLNNGLIRFVLGTSEMTEPGKVDATVQIFDADMKRISTAEFKYVAKKDPSLEGSLPTDDKTLVIANESLLTEAIEKADAADQRITETIASGTQLDEVIDARGTFPVLRDRLNNVETSLAQKANYKQWGTGSNVNMIAGYEGNAVASDLTACTISGGGKVGSENVIGGNLANVGTSNSNASPMTLGTDAQLAVIGGGYDNVINGKAGVITGFHCKIGTGATHGTISGGSYHAINSGDYNVISGGTQNTIAGSYATVSGGSGNQINADNSTVGGGNGNIANGLKNTIAGGFGNTSNGQNTAIGGGYQNNASADSSTIAGGYQQVASATYSAIGGGFKNTASGTYSSVVGGRENQATSPYSTVIGRAGKSTIEGEFVHADGMFSTAGDSQLSQIPLRRQTTDGTASTLGAGTGTASLNLPVDSTWGFTCHIVARRTDVDGESAMWEVKGLAQRGSTGSTNLVGTPTITEIGKSAGAAWTIGCRTSGFAIIFDITGEAGKSINWIGRLSVVQITG